MKRFLSAAMGLAAFSAPSAVYAQGVSLNYDALASLEEPLAVEVGDVTLSATGLLDAPVSFDLEDDGDVNAGFVGNFQLNAETQLPNRWTVGVSYFGQYETDPGSVIGLGNGDDDYSDNLAGFIGGAWGTLVGGQANGVVRENTRRLRGFGNGILAFDDMLGSLERLGGGYIGRFGPMQLSAFVDKDGQFEFGALWSRPVGNKDYRFTLRFRDGDFTSADGRRIFDSKGVGGVAEFIYGSWLFDLGLGYEDFSSGPLDFDRWYSSAGVRYKVGALSISAEGHYGQVDSQEEVSAALGIQYDIARGLSLNLGLNHAKSQSSKSGFILTNTKDTQGLASLRYSF